ncbi:MAG: DUF2336 domain-containing protein [Alphaproteobacteria bacterium]|nr:DUF2336 domain-containing protein [Alphaproteobacteria bacterium]
MSDLPSRRGGSSPDNGVMDYKTSQKLARHPDVDERRRLAARTDVRPEILYYLAEDPSPLVRREIALNTSTPAHADVLLARDGDDEVRCELAQKIARLTPHLSADTRERIRELTVEALEILAQDRLAQVRQALSDALKDVPNAPLGVIQKLARDVELAVAAPVLEFSPLLSDEDLLEIIESTAESGAMEAISRRVDVSGAVSDAIVKTRDEGAVAQLLANPSAQIREETLDWVVESSRSVDAWQMPLAKRPRLPRRAIAKLSEFVADSVLAMLHRRDDLDSETAGLVDKAVRARIEANPVALDAESGAPGSKGEGPDRTGASGHAGRHGSDERFGGQPGDRGRTAEYVQKLYTRGELDEGRLDDELFSGNRAFVIHALALMAGMPPSMVTRIVDARSAKAITALAWKAGLKMRFAIKLQSRLGNVPTREILHAKDGVDYPLSEDDMKWQLDFYVA